MPGITTETIAILAIGACLVLGAMAVVYFMTASLASDTPRSAPAQPSAPAPEYRWTSWRHREQWVLQAAYKLIRRGQPVTVKRVFEQVRRHVTFHQTVDILRSLRAQGRLPSAYARGWWRPFERLDLIEGDASETADASEATDEADNEPDTLRGRSDLT